jgi:hypothetical protein
VISILYSESLSVYKLQNLLAANDGIWSFANFFTEELESLKRSRGLVSPSYFKAIALESRLGQPGDWVASPSRNVNPPSLIIDKASTSLTTFVVNSPSRSVFFSSDGRAFFAPMERANVRMSGQFRGYEFQTESEALWVWVSVNAEQELNFIKSIKKLESNWSNDPRGVTDPLVKTVPSYWESRTTSAKSLVAYVDSHHTESQIGSTASLVVLQRQDVWRLRPKFHSQQNVATAARLSDFIISAQSGKSLGTSFTDAGTPVLEGSWLATGNVTKYLPVATGEYVLAEAGDVITPKIGERSRSRVVKVPGLVPASFLVLKVKENVSPEAISAFLNSDNASSQRAALCIEGTIYKTISPLGILEMIPDLEIADFMAKCKKLCEQ